MSFLKDVIVSRVSFVRKAANKRKFLLLKSDEGTIENLGDVVIKEEEIYKPMRNEVKTKLVEVLKSTDNTQKTVDEIIALVKSDTSLNLIETEVAEITDFVDFHKQASTTVADVVIPPVVEVPLTKTQEEIEKEEKDNMDNAQLLKQVEDLTTKLDVMTKSAQRRDILTFLQKECAFLPEDINKTADTIMELTAVNPATAETFKESLKKASVAVEHSSILKEVGSSTEALLKSEGDGFDLIRKFSADMSELKKSADGGVMTSESIVNLVKSYGNQFNDYRIAHILRAKREAI
jgi:hypothetical protein